MKRFVIHKQDSLRRENCRQYIDELDPNRKWKVEITEYRKQRSTEQNAFLHGVPLKILSDHTGYTLDEIREYLAGEFMGWEEYEVFGKKKVRPIKSSSQMDTSEMTKFIEYIQWWASSTLNIRIPSPNEYEGEY